MILLLIFVANHYFFSMRRFTDYSSFVKQLFKKRVQKISIDAGFTCPNRDGEKGKGGCSYCNNATFKPTYCNLEKSVTQQLDEGVAFFSKKYPDIDYLAYFQAYSNTYAPIDDLKRLYDEAIQHPKVIGLVIATRPDCVNEEILDYLGEISKEHYVSIEYGIESHLNRTLEKINRGHTFEESVWAIEETAMRNIHNCGHLILGLPGESPDEMLDQARIISKLPIENIKLHQLQIHKKTLMEKQFNASPEAFALFHNVEDYIDLVIRYLELLDPRIIVERFISQSPMNMLIAPKWGLKNFEFVAKLEKELERRDTYQGRFFCE